MCFGAFAPLCRSIIYSFRPAPRLFPGSRCELAFARGSPFITASEMKIAPRELGHLGAVQGDLSVIAPVSSHRPRPRNLDHCIAIRILSDGDACHMIGAERDHVA